MEIRAIWGWYGELRDVKARTRQRRGREIEDGIERAGEVPKWSRLGRSREITPGAMSLEGKYRIRSNEYSRDILLERIISRARH